MKKYLNLIIVIISLATVISGLVQMFSPLFVLKLTGAHVSPAGSHFFAIIGMFMTLFGALMLFTVYSAVPNRPAVMICALQKLGAFAAVGLGILNGIFSTPALGVALFDLISGILFIYYFTTIKSDEVH